MRYALPGSALVHAGMLGLFVVGLSWPPPEDAPAPASVSVSIVSLSSVAGNNTELVESSSTLSAVSAGSPVEALVPVTSEIVAPIGTTSEPLASEVVEPLEPSPAEATQSPPVDPTIAATAEPINAAEVVELTTEHAEALESALAPLEPLPTAVVEPASIEEAKVAPVPQTLSFERPSRPTPRPDQRPRQQRQPPRAAPPSQAGNGGQNQADAAAAARAPAAVSGQGRGGEAEVARYPGVVIGELRRALRRVGSSRGEVVVRFTVTAGGQLAGVSVARSSGSAAVDAAGIATVQRAAPFPPIPPAAARNSWTFDVPLAFGG